MDGRVVDIVDEAPVSCYELIELLGETMPPSVQPVINPWQLHVDGWLARRLSFVPTLATIYQAQRDGVLQFIVACEGGSSHGDWLLLGPKLPISEEASNPVDLDSEPTANG